jgi:hypothetical protein
MLCRRFLSGDAVSERLLERCASALSCRFITSLVSNSAALSRYRDRFSAVATAISLRVVPFVVVGLVLFPAELRSGSGYAAGGSALTPNFASTLRA